MLTFLYTLPFLLGETSGLRVRAVSLLTAAHHILWTMFLFIRLDITNSVDEFNVLPSVPF